MKPRIPFLRDGRAAAGAEFAMVVPVLVLFLLGMIDAGRFLWTLNQAEKATQMGVRYAVVNNFVAADLNDDFASTYNLVGGDPVPTSTFDETECTSGSCTGGWGYDGTAFTNVVNWMNKFFPEVMAANVRITYTNVGLGFAGDPNGPDVAALVTVELRNLSFQPLILFGGTVNLPAVKAMMTLEDAECLEDDGDPATEEETNCEFSN